MCYFVSLPGDASYASFLTSRLPQATIDCLMLAYSFSPKVQSIFWGPQVAPQNDRVLRTDNSKSLFAEK